MGDKDAERMAIALVRMFTSPEAATDWEDGCGNSIERHLKPGIRAALRMGWVMGEGTKDSWVNLVYGQENRVRPHLARAEDIDDVEAYILETYGETVDRRIHLPKGWVDCGGAAHAKDPTREVVMEDGLIVGFRDRNIASSAFRPDNEGHWGDYKGRRLYKAPSLFGYCLLRAGDLAILINHLKTMGL